MAKLTKESFIESLKEMSLLEIKELVDAMKEEFGVDPSAVAVAAAPAAAGGRRQLVMLYPSVNDKHNIIRFEFGFLNRSCYIYYIVWIGSAIISCSNRILLFTIV